MKKSVLLEYIIVCVSLHKYPGHTQLEQVRANNTNDGTITSTELEAEKAQLNVIFFLLLGTVGVGEKNCGVAFRSNQF